MTALQTLLKLKYDTMCREYPTLPPHCIVPKPYSDKTANGLTRCVIEFLQLSGHQAERISSTGRWIAEKNHHKGGKFIKGSGTKGTADVSSIIKGRSVKIEIKINDKQSPEQVKYQHDVESAGGVYLLVRNFQFFYDWYLNFIL